MRKSILILAAPALMTTWRVAGAQSAFWQQLGDTTLTRLVAEGLRAGTDVRAAEARVDASRAARRLSAFDLAPTVTAGGSALRTRQSMAQVPGLSSPLPQRDLYDVGFDAAWEIDLFGRVRRGVNAQGALADASESSLESVRVTLASEVARAYFELRGAQRQFAVATRTAELQRKTLALTQDRLAAGRGTAFDVERAKAALLLTQAALPNLRSQIGAAGLHVQMLVGRTPTAESLELTREGALPTLPDSLPADGARDFARRRPDVIAAERQEAAQTLLVGAAKADYMPRFSIGMSAGYTANEVQSLTRTGASRILFGPVVSYPLLDLGRVKQRVGIAEAHREEARTLRTATVLQAIEETERTVITYNGARERLRILDEAVKSSERAADLAQQRFEAGLTDFLQVLDAQRTLLDAENQLILGQTAAATSLIAFYKATGGSWPAR